jgi:NAD+ diphosphatase
MQTASLSPYFIDRVSHVREDNVWIQAQLDAGSTRLIAVYQSSVLCHNYVPGRPCFLSHSQVTAAPESLVFLGQVDGITYFSLSIQTSEAAEQLCSAQQATFQAYAVSAPMLESEYHELLSLACFSSYWHSRNHYCGSCASDTEISSAGHMRVCTSTDCAQRYFPSMDPAIIVLIEHEDRCLLGRQAHWPETMYSTLAGFVEPGETIEAAVAREVNEEAGIQIEDIRYHSSQAWLFPNSLMLGFNAKATSTDLQLDANELEAAAWFTRDQIRAQPQMLPNQKSISYALIQDWLNR